MNLTITFDECEHFGDMENYQSDLKKAGASILAGEVNTDADTGHVLIEIQDKMKFLELFRQTESFDFSNIA